MSDLVKSIAVCTEIVCEMRPISKELKKRAYDQYDTPYRRLLYMLVKSLSHLEKEKAKELVLFFNKGMDQEYRRLVIVALLATLLVDEPEKEAKV